MKRTRQERQLSFQNQRRKRYFEGWYFKQVSADESVILSIIPSMMRSLHQQKAIIQINLANKREGRWQIQTSRQDFPMSAFQHRSNPFSLRIGDNVFSRKGLSLNIKNSEIDIQGELSFGDFTWPPTSMLSPTIMGAFSYLPLMECIHAIASLHHDLKGSLQIQGQGVSFDQGIGYLEKDWGKSFPKSYVWLQSNHFRHRPSCLFFSWADIPLGPLRFPGFICHLWIEGQHHRFATYNGASCTFYEMTEDQVSLVVKKGPWRLSVRAAIEARGVLAAPKDGHMDHQIKEGLAGRIAFHLLNEKTGEAFEDETSLAGVEIVPSLRKIG